MMCRLRVALVLFAAREIVKACIIRGVFITLIPADRLFTLPLGAADLLSLADVRP